MTGAWRLAAKGALLAATTLGVALAAWLVKSVGWDDILQAIQQLGAGGLILLCLASFGIFGLLGAAWLTAADAAPSRIALFASARLIREAVSDFLPLSQLAGLAAGARVVRAAGFDGPRTYASMIVDQATELASQLVFTIVGVGAATSLLLGASGAAVRPMVLTASAALAILVLAFVLAQRRFFKLAVVLVRRFLPRAATTLGEIDAELGRLYARRARIAASFGWNFAAWLATVAAGWLALRLIGHPLPYWQMLSIESIVAAVRSIAFLVPGAIGFQEATYVLIGPLFGLSSSAGIALSLAKRARDVVMGLIAFAVWQWIETKAFLGERPTTT